MQEIARREIAIIEDEIARLRRERERLEAEAEAKRKENASTEDEAESKPNDLFTNVKETK